MILRNYINAMSVEKEGEKVFVPCFSDTCLNELTRGSFLLSPFRGIYYGWKLGEIAEAFNERTSDKAFTMASRLMDEVSVQYMNQSPSSNPFYPEFENALASGELRHEIDRQRNAKESLLKNGQFVPFRLTHNTPGFVLLDRK